ncbi:MAG TPA: 2-isopropylmalate synthase [Bacteroidota bacterium]|nr:2-isopropylmalate synthase [Bacteroidota bacterium]
MSQKIFVFDTTLRDGEQSPGCSMNFEEKIRMARQLERLQVDVIEAGFPIASDGDFESVREIAKQVKGCSVAALSRATIADIDRAWEALKPASKPRIHTFIATSDIHLKYKLRKTREQVLDDAVKAVRRAKSYCEEVEFSCEDGSRSDIGYLCQILEAVIAEGATVVNIPDTVGYSIPDEYGKIIRTLIERVPNISKATVSVHCHDDLGLAVANSLAGIANGARQVECTINGIGERAGNASLEEIAMAIKTRHEKLGFETNVNPEEIYKTSRLLTTLTGMHVQRNKAVVGENAFAHEAGIHQDGVLKNPLTYEIMTPQSIGIKHSTLVLGKHSGRHALKQRYSELGYELSTEELDAAYKLFTKIADEKKEVFDDDLIAILEDEVSSMSSLYTLENLQVTSGLNVVPTAMVGLKRNDEILQDSATGDGPVDAAYRAIERITGISGQLLDYSIKSVSWGHDAIGEVFVKIAIDGYVFNGRSASTDVITGSVKAYLNAINHASTARFRRQQNAEAKAESAAV